MEPQTTIPVLQHLPGLKEEWDICASLRSGPCLSSHSLSSLLYESSFFYHYFIFHIYTQLYFSHISTEKSGCDRPFAPDSFHTLLIFVLILLSFLSLSASSDTIEINGNSKSNLNRWFLKSSQENENSPIFSAPYDVNVHVLKPPK